VFLGLVLGLFLGFLALGFGCLFRRRDDLEPLRLHRDPRHHQVDVAHDGVVLGLAVCLGCLALVIPHLQRAVFHRLLALDRLVLTLAVGFLGLALGVLLSLHHGRSFRLLSLLRLGGAVSLAILKLGSLRRLIGLHALGFKLDLLGFRVRRRRLFRLLLHLLNPVVYRLLHHAAGAIGGEDELDHLACEVRTSCGVNLHDRRKGRRDLGECYAELIARLLLGVLVRLDGRVRRDLEHERADALSLEQLEHLLDRDDLLDLLLVLEDDCLLRLHDLH
jgi:hypothetical protein